MLLCERCTYCDAAGIFVLCKHSASRYKVADNEEQHHTCTHMRRTFCGPDGRLFSPAKENPAGGTLPSPAGS